MPKYVNLVELVNTFPTTVSASIQPRTSLSKFGRDPIHLLIRRLRRQSKLLQRPTRFAQRGPQERRPRQQGEKRPQPGENSSCIAHCHAELRGGIRALNIRRIRVADCDDDIQNLQSDMFIFQYKTEV